MTQILTKLLDSPEACADFLATIPAHLREHSSSWGGSLEDGITKLKTGDTTYVEQAQSLLSKIDQLNIRAPRVRLLAPALAGYMPNVPAFLAGQPYAMFAKAPSELDAPVTPINVYVECQVSAGVGQEHLVKRGIAILAFVMALEQRRPVDLWVGGSEQTNGNHHHCFTRIASRPLDIGRACFMLVSPTFARACMLSAQSMLAGRVGSGQWVYGGAMKSGYEVGVRKDLNLAPHDVFIKGGYLNDSFMNADPVAWVNEQLKRQDQIAEGEDVDNAA